MHSNMPAQPTCIAEPVLLVSWLDWLKVSGDGWELSPTLPVTPLEL